MKLVCICKGVYNEQEALWALVDVVRRQLIEEFHPDGFNVGINDGAAAGQTIFHAHVHVIPRFTGDVQNPRGGVRAVITRHFT